MTKTMTPDALDNLLKLFKTQWRYGPQYLAELEIAIDQAKRCAKVEAELGKYKSAKTMLEMQLTDETRWREEAEAQRDALARVIMEAVYSTDPETGLVFCSTCDAPYGEPHEKDCPDGKFYQKAQQILGADWKDPLKEVVDALAERAQKQGWCMGEPVWGAHAQAWRKVAYFLEGRLVKLGLAGTKPPLKG